MSLFAVATEERDWGVVCFVRRLVYEEILSDLRGMLEVARREARRMRQDDWESWVALAMDKGASKAHSWTKVRPRAEAVIGCGGRSTDRPDASACSAWASPPGTPPTLLLTRQLRTAPPALLAPRVGGARQ